jgi:hypothetical protein
MHSFSRLMFCRSAGEKRDPLTYSSLHESKGHLPPILGAKVGASHGEKSRKWPYGLQIQGN